MLVVVAAGFLGVLVGPLIRRAVDQVPGRHPLLGRSSDQGIPFVAGALVPVASWFATEPSGTRVLVGSPDDRDEDGSAETEVRRWRAPLIDLAAAIVLMALAHRVGWSWALPSFLVFGGSLVAVTVIDIDHYRIPDRIVFPSLAVCTPLLALAALMEDVPGGLIAAATGAAAYFTFLFVFFFIYPRGMGFGDVKLALLLGLHVGWAGAVVTAGGELLYRGWTYGMQLVLMGALIGSLLGAVVGIGVLIVMGRKGAFPFGPALCLGAVVAIVLSEQILN